jgi:hypothetical protein
MKTVFLGMGKMVSLPIALHLQQDPVASWILSVFDPAMDRLSWARKKQVWVFVRIRIWPCPMRSGIFSALPHDEALLGVAQQVAQDASVRRCLH